MQQNIIMQGDQYSITFGIDFNDKPLDVGTVEVVQFAIGNVVKLYKSDGSGDCSYDTDNNLFIFPVSQQETFLLNGMQDCQARIKFADGTIVGSKTSGIMFTFSSTKETI